jgi:hypothetical protein
MTSSTLNTGTRVRALKEERANGGRCPIALPGEQGCVGFVRDTCHGPLVGLVFGNGWLDLFAHELEDAERFEILPLKELSHVS